MQKILYKTLSFLLRSYGLAKIIKKLNFDPIELKFETQEVL